MVRDRRLGYNLQDNSRDTENAMFATLGLGKFINRNWSLDGQLNWQNPKANVATKTCGGASTASRWTCVATSLPKAATGIRTS